jgi:hypothetical protein
MKIICDFGFYVLLLIKGQEKLILFVHTFYQLKDLDNISDFDLYALCRA